MPQQIIFLKQALVASLIAMVLLTTSFILFEPQLLRAVTDNVVVTLQVDGGITISAGSDISMSPNIGIAVSTSTGSTSWTVVTNDPAGYTLNVQATGTPTMQSSANSISDYTELVLGTPDAWNVPAASNTAEFGFSAYGTDVATASYGTDQVCDDSSMNSATRLYDGLTTSDQLLASRTATTSVSGITTTFCVATEQSGTYLIPSGIYSAEIIATAIVQ